MRKLLFQFDSSRLPSAFDRVVAYDGGADEVLSYGGVVEADVRDLVHGAIFTRGLKDLRKTAVFIGGADMSAGERLLAEARKAFFGPFSVSVMLDSNGSNTTAVAAVAKAMQTVGDVTGRSAVVAAGTGPVGQRAAGLLARAGADVVITSRRHDEGEHIAQAVAARFGGRVSSVEVRDPSAVAPVLEGAQILINAGPAAVLIIPRDAWAHRPGLKVAIDLNAVPPLGIEGIDVNDNGVVREGVTVFGALGVGGFKMKVHKACIARLFERNDLVLDAESIADVANTLIPATA
jgi:threonine dehydrogenase-like Zn-dependent dehydrogenase